MDLTLEGEDLGWAPDTERVLRREVRRLELALVRRDEDGAAELHVTRTVRDDQVELQFLLRCPDGTEERADRFAADEKAAIPELVDELLTDLQDQHQAVDSVLTVFHALRRAARREVTLAELEGRLEPGSVDPDDVVDSAVADLLPTLSPFASPSEAFEELERAVIEQLNSPTQAEPGSDSLDRPLAESWPTEDADEPWNPEPQSFSLTELFADPEAIDQEEVIADREVRAHLVRALFRLERRVRLTWEEVVLSGGSVGRVALAQARTEQDLEDELDETRWLLAGVLAVPAARIDELYRALGRRYREEHPGPDRRS